MFAAWTMPEFTFSFPAISDGSAAADDDGLDENGCTAEEERVCGGTGCACEVPVVPPAALDPEDVTPLLMAAAAGALLTPACDLVWSTLGCFRSRHDGSAEPPGSVLGGQASGRAGLSRSCGCSGSGAHRSE